MPKAFPYFKGLVQHSKGKDPMASTEAKKEITSLRAADTKDIRHMAAVVIAAMELSPHWKWRYAYRKQYPDIHQKETENTMASYVRKSKDGICIALLAEVETEVEVEVEPRELTMEERVLGAPGRKKRKEMKKVKEIAGVAIAQLPGTFVEPMTRIIQPSSSATSPTSSSVSNQSTSTYTGSSKTKVPPTRADIHPERAKAFYAEFGPAKKRYFDFPYGNAQLYIDFMAVHPKYHRKGIGQKLLEWMLELAKKEEEARVVTLFSSPMGEGLYKKAGFEEVGSVSVKLEGDTGEGAEGIVAPVLVWSREKHVRAELY